ncbi:hypothetical protein E2C01_012203 [Portunus trituberculatus]|uniref:Uncharacterized protein n=1 Tax=Portunus trituberculatus TaxID=210409 RepID=A0A5B7DCW7_PORTR|nr:hypothetical protein [Portunus trituberculatus]
MKHNRSLEINPSFSVMWCFQSARQFFLGSFRTGAQVVFLYVELKQDLLVGTVWAHVTRVRLLSGVYPDVLPQVAFVCEGFITHRTRVDARQGLLCPPSPATTAIPSDGGTQSTSLMPRPHHREGSLAPPLWLEASCNRETEMLVLPYLLIH